MTERGQRNMNPPRGFKKAVESARLDGMRTALEIVRQGGADLLEQEIQTRERTGVYPRATFGELDGQADNILIHAIRQSFCIAVGAIHDCYGFGPKRMQPFFRKFTEGTELLFKGANGGALWTDYAAEIEKVYGVALKASRHGVMVIKKGEEGDGGKADQVANR